MKFKTDQEEFWAGTFGDEYVQRNQSELLFASNISFFSKALSHASGIKSIIEFGANIGMNLKAINLLLPESEMYAVEINNNAAENLKKNIPEKNISNTSILDFKSQNKYDLSLVKGVLIHINPDELNTAYQKLVNSTKKYLLIAEYYNPSPVAVEYRGYKEKLFKRDFAGEIMELYPEMKLIDYGFVYYRDPNFPQDDITWFLLQKSQ
ncbi:pseudaminic acid biosynthesis-associated methylase [Vreelandella rituensis]|uniref:Pseudaminic acid biosynthesis-associated methylase n=1 Tax=Vreelandella rituensis TaxID=2282306 RepID=A0A368U881_9GAMM|nr:pseudaminic acid biosynthesis-associated methylase [Halomonas rituensis]RCV93388.1 pseudaminic acid biosynthesis-associated methylase [Halomonas rituensis]